ncbi:YihY/virulence factor BrkB family protein [Marisediminicola senii]|uniref:YihY/virulence factor BrkB family protein n=1 Tax=Marisediminicola senii TaxID=2711233 RepID=UPI0019148D70|nr:YihY/virulence factor BrkB family protein [Marisediminicola senii]
MSDTGASQKLADAPSPDDSRKPDSPTEMEGRSWKYILRKTMREFSADQCTDLAAALTYYAVLAIFPALIAIISLLGVVGDPQTTTNTLLQVISDIAPGGAADVLRGPIESFAGSPAAGFALVSGIVLAIWSASGYVGAFTRAMNRVYEIDEGRTFLKLKPLQLLVTLTGILLILAMIIILVISGPVTDAIAGVLGLGETVQIVWSIAKWPVLAAILVVMVAILYYATPNAKQPKFRWMSIGALLAIVVLAVASVAFGFYVSISTSYDSNYGPLAGVIVFLLWLWIANLALLFGAEFDAELERGRQLQAGIAAEEDIQLPPRGTKKSDKAAAAEAKDVAEGRRIRQEAAFEQEQQARQEAAEARAAKKQAKRNAPSGRRWFRGRK